MKRERVSFDHLGCKMSTKAGLRVSLFLLVLALPFSSPGEAHAGPFLDWLFGRPTYYYAPVQPVVVQQPIGAPRYAVQRPLLSQPVLSQPVAIQPTVARRPFATQSYVVQRPAAPAYATQAYAVQPRVVQYAPVQYAAVPVFRTMWFRAPVTYYRPVAAPVSPATVVVPAASPNTTYYGGCTTQQWQVRRLPTTYVAPAVVAPGALVAPSYPATGYPATGYPSQPATAPPAGFQPEPFSPAAPPSRPSTHLAPADQAPTLKKPVHDDGGTNATERETYGAEGQRGNEAPAAPAAGDTPPAAHDHGADGHDHGADGHAGHNHGAAALPRSIPSQAVLTPVRKPSSGAATGEQGLRPTPNRSHRSLRLLPDPDWRRESPAAPPLNEPEDRTARNRQPTSKFAEIMRRAESAQTAKVVRYSKIARPVRESIRQVSAQIATPSPLNGRIDQNDSGWRSARSR